MRVGTICGEVVDVAEESAAAESSRPAKNNGQDSGLIPQPHGGALRPGGLVGHKGGPGRPKSKFKAIMRREFKRVRGGSLLAKIAEDKDAAHKDRIAALKLLGEWGHKDELVDKHDVNLNGNVGVQHSGVMIVTPAASKEVWEDGASNQQQQLAQQLAADEAASATPKA